MLWLPVPGQIVQNLALRYQSADQGQLETMPSAAGSESVVIDGCACGTLTVIGVLAPLPPVGLNRRIGMMLVCMHGNAGSEWL